MAVPQPGFEEVVVDPVPLGRYVLLDPIARGRTGTVHRACLNDGTPDDLLAVKRISAEVSADRDRVERFLEVVGRASQLEHPAHCAILDVEQAEEGSLYVAMELIAGKDLGRVAAQLDEIGRSMPPQLVAHVGAQIADALEAAHGMTRDGRPSPLHHGDLSPADILIGYDGRVQLTGLGTAELALVAPHARYRAPELARGGPCTARSDVYALGACLYEVLTGRSAEVADPRVSESRGRRRPESHITKVVPRPLEEIVARALAERPEARWQTAAEMGRALQRWGAAQRGRSDASALAMFMISIFDATIADEDKRLRAWLEQAASAQPRTSRAAPSEEPSLPARNSYARLVRASARPVPSTQLQDWTDPSEHAEHTPPRGLLMRKLAADMVDPSAGEPAPDAVPVPAQSAPAAPPAASRELPAHRTAGLAFGELLSDESWDDESPAAGWIAASEERAHSVPPKAPASSAPASSAAASNEPASNAPASSAPTSKAPPRLPPMRKRAITSPRSSSAPAASAPAASAPPASTRPASARPASSRAAPSRPAPSRPAPPPPSVPVRAALPTAFSVPAPAPFQIAPVRPRRPGWLAPALVAGALALVVAAIAILRGSGGELSTLHVRTRPSGAVVFLRGERLGTAPLTRDDLQSGAAALELRAPGFERAARTIQLERGKAVYLDVDLIRSADRAAAPPSTAASREADLQAQLAAARLVEQSAEGAAVGDDGAHGGDRDGRARRHASADARSSADEPAERADAPAEVPAAGGEAVLELTPTAAEPDTAEAAPVPAPAPAKVVVPAPATVAPAARASRGAPRAPVLVKQVAPRFPARARRMGVAEGTVSIEFTIDAAGSVRDASVVKADPPGLFDDAALRAIEKWRYDPKLEAGAPVTSRQRFTFRFED